MVSYMQKKNQFSFIFYTQCTMWACENSLSPLSNPIKNLLGFKSGSPISFYSSANEQQQLLKSIRIEQILENLGALIFSLETILKSEKKSVYSKFLV